MTTSAPALGKKIRYLLNLIHHFLLAAHLGMMMVHSIKTGFFGIEFWLTFIVNILLLLDLEKITEKLMALTQRRPSVT